VQYSPKEFLDGMLSPECGNQGFIDLQTLHCREMVLTMVKNPTLIG
jgi:hypothetical protein